MDVGKLHQSLDALKGLVNEVATMRGRIARLESQGQGAINNDLLKQSIPVPVPAPAPAALYTREQCGVNLPWVQFGNDIVGYPAWGKKSLATDSKKRDDLLAMFNKVEEMGFGTVRFWLFPSLWHNSGFYTASMVAEARQSCTWLVSLAQQAGVKLIPTLLSFDNYSKDKQATNKAMQPFHHTSHKALIEGCLEGLATKKDSVDYIDIMNEPEWSTTGIPNADPQDKMHAQDAATIATVIATVQGMCKAAGFKSGIGSASLKWKDSNLITNPDVVDYHAYHGWSTKYFPPTSAEGTGLYMGETDIPYSQWGQLFKDGKYAKVFLWLESKDYSTSGAIDIAKLEKTLTTLKST